MVGAVGVDLLVHLVQKLVVGRRRAGPDPGFRLSTYLCLTASSDPVVIFLGVGPLPGIR